jgi:lipoprotein-releasing system permease protein
MILPFYISKRLFSGREGKREVSRPAILVATAGVALGLAVMIISISVMFGFKKEIRDKVEGFGGQLQVMNMQSFRSNETYPIAFDDSLLQVVGKLPGVKHAQRYTLKPGMLKTDDNFRGVQLKGVGKEYDFTFLKKNLKEGNLPDFSQQEGGVPIVISRMVADELHLGVDSKVFAYFFEGTIRVRRFHVVGIYQTNMKEFDKNLVFTDINTVTKLNGWESNQVSGVEMSLTPGADAQSSLQSAIRFINPRLDAYGAKYATYSIEELYPQLFQWLDMLDLNIWIILILMILVASFTMIAGLLIIILEHTNFIGILKALGATNRQIRQIFLYFASFVILRGLVVGNVIALVLIFSQQYLGWAHLDASTYYLERVPVLFQPAYWGIVNAATFLLCVMALLIPCHLVSYIHPAKSIRFE